VRVGERFPQRVFERALPKPQSAAQSADHVRRLAHALHTACQHDVGFTQLDHLGAADCGLDAGAAQAIDGQRRDLHRHAGLEAHVSRAVDGVRARVQHVAEHDVIDLTGIDTGARHRGARGNRAEVERRDVFERADVLRHGRARTAEDEHVGMTHSLPPAAALESSGPGPRLLAPAAFGET
jgi:hypothetical protein